VNGGRIFRNGRANILLLFTERKKNNIGLVHTHKVTSTFAEENDLIDIFKCKPFCFVGLPRE